MLIGIGLFAGCSAPSHETAVGGSSAPSDSVSAAESGSVEESGASADGDPNALLTVGDIRNELPMSIGDYRLLTPEIVAENGMSCSESPLNGYSDGVFWSFEGTTASLIYVTDEGIASTSAYAGYCWGIGAAVAEGFNADADETFPGVIEVVFGSMDEPQENAEVECRSTSLITGCSKRYPGLITYVSVKEAVAADTDAQDVFLSRFLNTFVQAHPMVAERTTGFPDMH